MPVKKTPSRRVEAVARHLNMDNTIITYTDDGLFVHFEGDMDTETLEINSWLTDDLDENKRFLQDLLWLIDSSVK
jgi:hypothetical protein